MAELLQAVYEYGVKFVILVGIMLIGINLGKVLRIKKDSKSNKDE